MPSPPPIDLTKSANDKDTDDPEYMKGAVRNFFRNGERSKLRKARKKDGVSPDIDQRLKDSRSPASGTNGNSVLVSSPKDNGSYAVPMDGTATLSEAEASQWRNSSGTADEDASSPYSDEPHESVVDLGRPTYAFPPLDNEKNGFSAPPDVEDDDPYSHAAMSIRAEQILANAKKRLTVSFPIDPRHSILSTDSSRTWRVTSIALEAPFIVDRRPPCPLSRTVAMRQSQCIHSQKAVRRRRNTANQKPHH